MQPDMFQLIRLNKRDEYFSTIDSIDINQCNEGNANLLHHAIAHNPEFASDLIHRGIDVNHQDGQGQTPLHYAVIYRNRGLVEQILDAGGNVRISDEHGNSPLWYAAGDPHRDYHIIRLLMEHKSDPHHKNNHGRSAIDIAVQRDNAALREILES